MFFGFRIMVGVGMLMLLVSWTAAWRLRGPREPSRALAFVLTAMSFAGWVATVAGWYVTEMGRQPWLVQGVLPTAAAQGPVGAGAIGASLTIYLTLYVLLLIAYVSVVFYLARKAAAGEIEPERGRLDSPLRHARAG